MPKHSKREGSRRAGCCLASMISRVCRSYSSLVLFPRSYPGRNLIRLPFESSRLEPNWIEWLVAAGARISHGEWKDTLAKYLTSLSENSEPRWKRGEEERKEDTVFPSTINFSSVPRIDRTQSVQKWIYIRINQKIHEKVFLRWEINLNIIINLILLYKNHHMLRYKVIICIKKIYSYYIKILLKQITFNIN